MIKAAPIPSTVHWISSWTMIARCLNCGGDLVQNPEPVTTSWYHYRTGRALCFVGIHPSEKLVDQFVNNL